MFEHLARTTNAHCHGGERPNAVRLQAHSQVCTSLSSSTGIVEIRLANNAAGNCHVRFVCRRL